MSKDKIKWFNTKIILVKKRLKKNATKNKSMIFFQIIFVLFKKVYKKFIKITCIKNT